MPVIPHPRTTAILLLTIASLISPTILIAKPSIPFAGQAHRNQNQNESANDEVDSAGKYFKKLGASLTEDDNGKIVGFQLPESLALAGQAWLRLEKLKDLQDLDLAAQHLSNDALKSVGKLKHLRTLNLFGNPLDSIALTHITELDKLETLYLYRTFIDDKGIESIAKLKNLKRLNMMDTFLTDKGLDLLGTCKQLRHLTIGNSKARNSQEGKFPESFFTPAGVERLRENLPKTNITYWGEKDDRLDLPAVIQKSKNSKIDEPRRASIQSRSPAPAPNLAKRKGLDWPTFLGPSANGKSDEKGLNLNWYDNPPKLVWHRKIGTGYSAPSIANGRLLLYQRVRTTTGNQRFAERLSCLQSETGKTIWKVDFSTDYEDLSGYGDGPRSTPVIDGARVYILSPAGMLRCLQVVDGKLLWSLDLKAEFNCDLISYGVGTTPVVFKNLLLIIAGGQPFKKSDETKTDFDAGIVAIDKVTGVFQYGLGKSTASYATPVICSMNNRFWCLAFTRDGLLGFNPDSAKIDFEFPWRSNIAGCVNAATPVTNGNRVFISEAYTTGGVMLQFNEKACSSVWQDDRRRREKSLALHWATPIFHEGKLYGCSGRHSVDGMLKCINWYTGETIWQEKMLDRTSMAFVDGHLLNLGENGLLTAVKATPTGYQTTGRLGEENTTLMPSYPVWVAPVVARGMIYLRGKHEIICYDIAK